MTEEEAQAWIDAQFDVSRETGDKLKRFVALLLDEADRQNLISDSTRPHIWARHIVDSAQLLPLARPAGDGPWVDLGAGAGLPGIVIAILGVRPVILIEERKKRAAFLEHLVADLDLAHCHVRASKVERCIMAEPAAVISARAYAPLPRLLDSARHLATKDTLWLLPKGRNYQNEMDQARLLWQGAFHVEQSVTDPDSAVLSLNNMQRKG